MGRSLGELLVDGAEVGAHDGGVGPEAAGKLGEDDLSTIVNLKSSKTGVAQLPSYHNNVVLWPRKELGRKVRRDRVGIDSQVRSGTEQFALACLEPTVVEVTQILGRVVFSAPLVLFTLDAELKVHPPPFSFQLVHFLLFSLQSSPTCAPIASIPN